MLLPSSLVHLIYGDSLCFRQEKYSKAHHNHNPHSEEEEGRGFHVAHHRQERLSYDESADHNVRVFLGDGVSGLQMNGQDPSRDALPGQHLDGAFHEQKPSAEAVGEEDGDDGGDGVDAAGDHGGQQRRVGAEADGLEQDGRVEHDHVHAGELLEEGEERAAHELGPARPLHQVPERAFLLLAALDEARGSLVDEKRAEAEDEGRHRGSAQRNPPPVSDHPRGSIVDQIRNQYAEGD
nr:hypothetical protein PanWU01x14_097900 [Ipomoea batatas]